MLPSPSSSLSLSSLLPPPPPPRSRRRRRRRLCRLLVVLGPCAAVGLVSSVKSPSIPTGCHAWIPLFLPLHRCRRSTMIGTRMMQLAPQQSPLSWSRDEKEEPPPQQQEEEREQTLPVELSHRPTFPYPYPPHIHHQQQQQQQNQQRLLLLDQTTRHHHHHDDDNSNNSINHNNHNNNSNSNNNFDINNISPQLRELSKQNDQLQHVLDQLETEYQETMTALTNRLDQAIHERQEPKQPSSSSSSSSPSPPPPPSPESPSESQQQPESHQQQQQPPSPPPPSSVHHDESILATSRPPPPSSSSSSNNAAHNSNTRGASPFDTNQPTESQQLDQVQPSAPSRSVQPGDFRLATSGRPSPPSVNNATQNSYNRGASLVDHPPPVATSSEDHDNSNQPKQQRVPPQTITDRDSVAMPVAVRNLGPPSHTTIREAARRKTAPTMTTRTSHRSTPTKPATRHGDHKSNNNNNINNNNNNPLLKVGHTHNYLVELDQYQQKLQGKDQEIQALQQQVANLQSQLVLQKQEQRSPPSPPRRDLSFHIAREKKSWWRQPHRIQSSIRQWMGNGWGRLAQTVKDTAVRLYPSGRVSPPTSRMTHLFAQDSSKRSENKTMKKKQQRSRRSFFAQVYQWMGQRGLLQPTRPRDTTRQRVPPPAFSRRVIKLQRTANGTAQPFTPPPPPSSSRRKQQQQQQQVLIKRHEPNSTEHGTVVPPASGGAITAREKKRQQERLEYLQRVRHEYYQEQQYDRETAQPERHPNLQLKRSSSSGTMRTTRNGGGKRLSNLDDVRPH